MEPNKLPKIACVCCTYGRHTQLERVVRCFMDQDYAGEACLIIYNTGEKLNYGEELIPTPDNRTIFIAEPPESYKYDNVGDKYRDATGAVLDAIEERFGKKFDIFTSFDDDDIFLPSHLRRGAEGWLKATSEGMRAYKPYYSYYCTKDETGNYQVQKAHNTLEPSIFVSLDHVVKYGFKPHSCHYHSAWLEPLEQENLIRVDVFGEPTLMYMWVGEVFKMSGDPENPDNFNNHAHHSTDMGDGIIDPVPDNSFWYNLINKV